MASPEQNRFMAVVFTEPHGDGEEMPDWHQHMTVFPWMRGDMQAAIAAMQQTAEGIKPITALALFRDHLEDRSRQIEPVWLLEPRERLTEMHRKLLAAAGLHGALEDDRFTGETSYVPHVTIHPGQPDIDQMTPVFVTGVSIVQKVGDERRIVVTIPLRGRDDQMPAQPA